MVLDESQVIEKLNDSLSVPKFIMEARERTKTLKALFDGDDFQDELSKIEHIEKSEDKWRARKKYSRSIVDLNERLFRYLDNVYSATGGTKIYDIKGEQQKKTFIDTIRKVRGNQSLERWLQANWMPAYHSDPHGTIFIESKRLDDGTAKPYPTYKSIESIRNYEWDGQNLEWIIFEPKTKLINRNHVSTYRIVDDEQDRTFRFDGGSFTIIPELTIKNEFGECPGLINSNITKVGREEIRLSPANNIIGLEQDYLRDQSILSIVKFLNGFKNLVRPKVVCTTCRGVGKTGENTCKSCDGKGFKVNMDVTDEIILPIDLNNPDLKIPDATTLATYIGLDVETWDQYRKELQILDLMAHETIWGSHQVSNQDGSRKTERTATEVWVNTQPVINRLNKYSDAAEFMEWQISEWIANFIDTTKDKDKKVITISLGRRFIIDPPDELLRVYREGKKDQVSASVSDKQLNEYLTAKYKNDPQQLRIELLKVKLELYVHYTIEQVNSIYGNKEAMKKGLFSDWWESLDQIDYEKDITALENNRDIWINEKISTFEVNEAEYNNLNKE